MPPAKSVRSRSRVTAASSTSAFAWSRLETAPSRCARALSRAAAAASRWAREVSRFARAAASAACACWVTALRSSLSSRAITWPSFTKLPSSTPSQTSLPVPLEATAALRWATT